jgi:hypothetical protein
MHPRAELTCKSTRHYLAFSRKERQPKVRGSSKEKARLSPLGPCIPVQSLRAKARGIIWLFHVKAQESEKQCLVNVLMASIKRSMTGSPNPTRETVPSRTSFQPLFVSPGAPFVVADDKGSWRLWADSL